MKLNETTNNETTSNYYYMKPNQTIVKMLTVLTFQSSIHIRFLIPLW